jgi:endoglucanase
MLVVLSAAVGSAFPAGPECQPWPPWEAFNRRFIQGDGRVIDHHASAHSTSEGQAYALLLALIANDRTRFDKLLVWTRDNLAAGDLSARLPAWQWGKREDGSWGVLDANSAADADVWLAYALLEGGRLWRESRYRALGVTLVERIRNYEVADLPGFGPMLLPGADGFKKGDELWRLNPSYLPVQALRRFAAVDAPGPWSKIAEGTLKLVAAAAPFGYVSDWVAFRRGEGFVFDPEKGTTGSFDAIRVYLWAGMLASGEKLRAPLLRALGGMRRHLADNLAPPLRVDAASGKTEGAAPVGHSAALLPYLKSLNETALLVLQQRRVVESEQGQQTDERPRYYDQVLALFGQGWIEGRYHFNELGQLVPDWGKQCVSARRRSA